METTTKIIAECEHLRKELQANAKQVLKLRNYAVKDEALANIVLAYHDLEDARMRLDKVLQAEDAAQHIRISLYAYED